MKFRMLLLIGALFASCLPKAAGLSYSPEAFLSWEEVVANSDFVGVIECVRAGAHVSEFVVSIPGKAPSSNRVSVCSRPIRSVISIWPPYVLVRPPPHILKRSN